MAGHNILHKLNSTVSCRLQKLRQEATFRCEVLKLLFHLSLKDITVYINDIKFFEVKAYYSMVTDNEIYFVADFQSMTLQLVYSPQSTVYSYAFFSIVDPPNPQISKLTHFRVTNRSVYQLNCNEVTLTRHYITCDIFNLLNHSFSSAFSQKGYY